MVLKLSGEAFADPATGFGIHGDSVRIVKPGCAAGAIIGAGAARQTSESTERVWRNYGQNRVGTEEGAQIISEMPGFGNVAEIVLCHHERIDGRGYPRALKDDDVPWPSRMISVADTFDVMTARDSYREPLSHAAAVLELRRVAGSQLDRRLVSVFVEMVEGRRLAFVPKDIDVLAELRASGEARVFADAGQPLWAAAAAA